MIQISYSKKTHERCLQRCGGQPFLTVDPGAHGCMTAWSVPLSAHFKRIVLLGRYSGAAEAGEVARMLSIRVFIIEQPFLGKDPDAAIKLGESIGYLLGTLQSFVPVFTVIRVRPSSWQSVLRLPARSDRAAIMTRMQAMLQDDEQYSQYAEILSKADLEGLASAMLIGRWWQQLV